MGQGRKKDGSGNGVGNKDKDGNCPYNKSGMGNRSNRRIGNRKRNRCKN